MPRDFPAKGELERKKIIGLALSLADAWNGNPFSCEGKRELYHGIVAVEPWVVSRNGDSSLARILADYAHSRNKSRLRVYSCDGTFIREALKDCFGIEVCDGELGKYSYPRNV